jgi:hypothetical protein
MNLKSEPRFLHLWFSHSALEGIEFHEISLLDGTGKPSQLGGGVRCHSSHTIPMTAMAILVGLQQP